MSAVERGPPCDDLDAFEALEFDKRRLECELLASRIEARAAETSLAKRHAWRTDGLLVFALVLFTLQLIAPGVHVRLQAIVPLLALIGLALKFAAVPASTRRPG